MKDQLQSQVLFLGGPSQPLKPSKEEDAIASLGNLHSIWLVVEQISLYPIQTCLVSDYAHSHHKEPDTLLPESFPHIPPEALTVGRLNPTSGASLPEVSALTLPISVALCWPTLLYWWAQTEHRLRHASTCRDQVDGWLFPFIWLHSWEQGTVAQGHACCRLMWILQAAETGSDW